MLNNTSKGCPHNVYIKGLCGNCGVRLDPPQSTSVSMIHSVPELKVSEDLARKIGKDDQEKLLAQRKLVLLVDLDQTILHTTHEQVKNDPNVHSFTLWPGHPTYYTKLRPHLKEFLDEMSQIYELHIFTFGCRKYAHKIASIIDPQQKYFGNRILSRDESVDQYSKKGNLNNLFPCGDAMVCIIDDRSDVWKDAANLIQVKPYSYFKTSISDGAYRGFVEDDESLERDVDKLEALLGLDDDDCDEDNDDGDAAQANVKTGEDNEGDNEVKREVRLGSRREEDENESSEENLKKKTKTSDSQDQEIVTKDCDTNERKTKGDSGSGYCNTGGSSDKTSSSAKVRFEEEEKKKDEQEETGSSSPQSPIEDPDDHLLYLPSILKRIHKKWYKELDYQRSFLVDGETYKLPEIKDIIRTYLRKKF